MSTKQGYIKDFESNKMLPETTTVMVTDVARSQALSASLLALVEKNALGYPDFTTTDDWPAGTQCFYDRKLWNFTSDHAAGDWDANDVEEFSVKEYMDALANKVETVKSEYLKKGTYSADTAVGLADNLRGQTVDSEAYLIRPTGGTENEVANGVASVLGMEGNSAVWNQLISIPSSSISTTANGVTFIDNRDGSYTFYTADGGATAQTDIRIVNGSTTRCIYGYKYFQTGIRGGSSSTYRFVNQSSSSTGNNATGPIIFTASDTKLDITLRIANGAVITTPVTIKPQVINLTLLGIDNLTTVAEVEAWLAQHVGTKPYYAYNAGTILSAQTLGIKTYGQNLLNPTTKQAKLISYTWVENGTTYSNQYTIKNVPSGATATFTPDATGVAESVTITDDKFDITSYGSGVLELSAATANTYVCIRWNGTKDNDIVPYEEHTYDFDVRKVYGKRNGAGEYVQCFPNGMRSAGSVHDILTANEAVVNIKEVLMSSLQWNSNSSYGYYSQPSDIYSATLLNTPGNIISTLYPTSGANQVTPTSKTIGLTGKYIKVSSNQSSSDFSNTIAGHYIQYKLATPIIYTDLVYRDNGVDRPLADVLMNITVNNWSMEEQLMAPYVDGNPTSIPATIKTQYGMDAVEAIDTLQKTCYFADDVRANLQALLTCVNTNCSETLGGTFGISETATDKVFEFTFTPNTEPDVEPTNEGE